MTAIVSFIVVIGVLILIHELGHFLVAKRFGVKIEKFSIGFGPKIFAKTVGDTEYRLSWIPLGGYVKMLGETDPEKVAPEDLPHSFSALSVSKRMMIAAAGPVANFLLAILLFAAVFWSGLPVMEAVVGQVLPASPAAKAGIEKGDRILSVNGHIIERWDDLRRSIERQGGHNVLLSVRRGDKTLSFQIVPRVEAGKNLFGEAENQGKIGVGPSGTFVTVRYGFSEGLGLAVIKTWRIASINLISLGKMVTGHISPKNLGGPILIAQMSAKAAKSGLSNLLVFMGFVSVTLGVMNLLPIPVLDGGHLLFLAAEGILRKPPSLRVRELSMQVGFVILLTIMVFAFYNDIMRVFGTGR